MERHNFIFFILTDSSSQLSYKKVSWHRTDAYIITIATDAGLPDWIASLTVQNDTSKDQIGLMCGVNSVFNTLG